MTTYTKKCYQEEKLDKYKTDIRPLSDLPFICEHFLKNEKTYKKRRGSRYYNVPCSFDIETTSTYIDGEKVGIMYEWTLGINDCVVTGRTWEDFVYALKTISDICDLSEDKRLVCYVANLAFEFQFMRKWLEWVSVFATDERKPVKALCSLGIEFRCSMILSGYSLATTAKNLTKYKVEKMVGDLDYDLIRNQDTNLSTKEWKYCENDVRVVMNYIRERIEADGNITKIPLTKTGYVRKYLQKECLTHGTYQTYRGLMNSLVLHRDEYLLLRSAFQGGFTHACAWHVGKVYNNVASYDFTSSYPTCLVAFNEFPIGRGIWRKVTNREELQKYCNLYFCVFEIEFENIREKLDFDHPISVSHCYNTEDVLSDNGRLVSAKRIRTVCTNLDYWTYQDFYDWDNISIGLCITYTKGYLPTPIVKSILNLYVKKTTLKGVAGMEEEYQSAKADINSVYGAMVTDVIRPEQTYIEDMWGKVAPDIDEQIERYNESKSRVSFYAWGVACTALARANLFTGIKEFGVYGDYIYSDTDSIKVMNHEKHMDYINNYNVDIVDKLHKAMDYHGLTYDMISPKTIKGIEKPLGVWEFERVYDEFKTLGAKRYAVRTGEEYSITVSGVNKNIAVPWMVKKYGKKFFNAFDYGLFFPEEATGKLTHTYIDDERKGVITDYQGHTQVFYEKSCIHLEKTSYDMTADDFINFLKGYRND